MANIRTFTTNAFESTLTAQMGPTATSATVASFAGGPPVPCYLVIDPDDPAKREYILFDGSVSGNSITTTSVSNRYLAGSASASGITHEIGAVVRVSPLRQHLDDLHDRIESRMSAAAHTKALHDSLGIDHGTLSGLGSDSHPMYIRADGTRSFTGSVSGVTPTAAAHLTRKDYVDGVVATRLLKSGDTMTGPLNMNGQQVTRPVLHSYKETALSNGTGASITIYLDSTHANARNFYHSSRSGQLTVSWNGIPSGTNEVVHATLVTAASVSSIVWPSGTRFAGGMAPDVSGGETWISIVAYNGAVTVGAAWTGVA